MSYAKIAGLLLLSIVLWVVSSVVRVPREQVCRLHKVSRVAGCDVGGLCSVVFLSGAEGKVLHPTVGQYYPLSFPCAQSMGRGSVMVYSREEWEQLAKDSFWF
jgi:hypothetical protein